MVKYCFCYNYNWTIIEIIWVLASWHIANGSKIEWKTHSHDNFSCTVRQDRVCHLGGPLRLIMACPEKYIMVTSSNYGRTDPYASVCPNPHSLSGDLACTGFISDQLQTCENQPSCVVDVVVPAVDKCPNTGKYAEVQYTCTGKGATVWIVLVASSKHMLTSETVWTSEM